MYPTVDGDSKQVRELLKVVRERLKSAIDNDVYIPVGYPKHFLDNPLSGHTAFSTYSPGTGCCPIRSSARWRWDRYSTGTWPSALASCPPTPATSLTRSSRLSARCPAR